MSESLPRATSSLPPSLPIHLVHHESRTPINLRLRDPLPSRERQPNLRFLRQSPNEERLPAFFGNDPVDFGFRRRGGSDLEEALKEESVVGEGRPESPGAEENWRSIGEGVEESEGAVERDGGEKSVRRGVSRREGESCSNFERWGEDEGG